MRSATRLRGTVGLVPAITALSLSLLKVEGCVLSFCEAEIWTRRE